MTQCAADQENLPGPLEGIRIVEYGVFHAGPGADAKITIGNSFQSGLPTAQLVITSQTTDKDGQPQILFPVGEEGGRLRAVQSAVDTGKITGRSEKGCCRALLPSAWRRRVFNQ